MNITEFHTLTDKLFNQVELFLDNYADEHNSDIDYEMQGNVINIVFPNNSKIIVNTQEPLLQIWLATRQQGYHFDYVNNQWFCNRSNEPFDKIFAKAVEDQAEN